MYKIPIYKEKMGCFDNLTNKKVVNLTTCVIYLILKIRDVLTL